MKKDGYYSSGEFAKLANVTKKTLRYYDEKNILKPSCVTDSGARFYSNEDLGRMQQILLLKYLGFSLRDIKEMIVADGHDHLQKFLDIQHRLVEDRIEQLKLVSQSILHTSEQLQEEQEPNWSQMLDIIHLTSMENTLKNQYKNASNISARIRLHTLYSQNRQGWFPWIAGQFALKEDMTVLEVGCGDGTLWRCCQIPENTSVILTDISDGMIRDVKRELGNKIPQLRFETCDCQYLPFDDQTFDLVIANHVLFYCEDVQKACREIRRVLKPDGCLIAGTYGQEHMKEVSELVAGFDDRIVLSGECLYERFGKENGASVLESAFSKVEWRQYEDALLVTESDALISYVISCHGNQNQYIVDCYDDFKEYVKKRTKRGFYITKDAGIFFAKK